MKDEELAGQAWLRGTGLQSKLLTKGGGRTTNSRPKKAEDVSSVGGSLSGVYKHHLLHCSKEHTEQDILGRKLAAQKNSAYLASSKPWVQVLAQKRVGERG